MSCDNSYGIPKYPSCSGHGDCIDNFCFCHVDWTSITDFHPKNGIDCDINILSIKIISGIVIILFLPAIIMICRHIILNQHKNTNDIFESKVILPWCLFSVVLLGMISSLIKIVNPVQYIVGGRNVGSIILLINKTVMYIIQNIMACNSAMMFITFLESYLKVLNDESRYRISKAVILLKKINIPLGIFHSTLLLIDLFTPVFSQYADYFNIIHCTNILLFSLTDSLRAYLFYKVVFELNSFIISSQIIRSDHRQYIQDVHDKLAQFVNKLRKAGIVTAIINTVLIFWYYIRRKFIYFELANAFIFIPIMWDIMNTLTTTKYSMRELASTIVSLKQSKVYPINTYLKQPLRINKGIIMAVSEMNRVSTKRSKDIYSQYY